MHVSTKRWGPRALVLATALALGAPSVVVAADRGRGVFDDTPVITCVDGSGNESRHECATLDEHAIQPIQDGWWLLEEASAPKNKTIEVTGDANIVCSGAVDLGSGWIEVAKGASLNLYAERGCEDSTSISSTSYVAIKNFGALNHDALGEVPFPVKVLDWGQVTYLDEGGTPQVRLAADFACDLLEGWHHKLGSGWYYASENTVLTERVDITGDVTIVVPDGVTLKCEKGIHVPKGSSLTILGQKGRGGTVLAELTDLDCVRYNAGIGGNANDGCGTVTICDVTVRAIGGRYGAGIGGGRNEDGGKVTIRRSNVYAKGRAYSAGIGGGGSGEPGKGGIVVIEDSKVTAESGEDCAAAIGGAGTNAWCSNAGGGDVTILGDSVVDAKSRAGAAIGRAENAKNPGKVTLSDNLRVVDLDNGGAIAPFNLRGEYCKYRNHVRVEPGVSK